jgi:Right handed beta helix region
MQRTSRMLAVAFAVAALATIAVAVPAQAKTIDVMPGQSIQAAIDSASPGDTIVVHPGTYHENVLVNKNNITLRGSGASSEGTVLLPPKNPPKGFRGQNGIAVYKKVDFSKNKVIEKSRGVRVTGFLVRGFPGFGVFAFGATHFVFAHNSTIADGAYGLAAFNSHYGQILYNYASSPGEADIYVGDSQQAHITVRGNEAVGSTFGIFIRDDSKPGLVADNKVHANCVGIVFLNTPSKGADQGWIATSNHVFHNDRACGGSEGQPPFSGIGIALAGAKNVTVAGNTVWGNKPSKPSPLKGGIVVASSDHPKIAPTGDLIKSNQAYNNKPDDITWDGTGSGNKFVANKCGSSKPNGLCH